MVSNLITHLKSNAKITIFILIFAFLGNHFLTPSSMAATYTVNYDNASTADDEVTINSGIFNEFIETGAGSGVFTRLFSIQKNSVEKGYNYDGTATKPFDQKNGSFAPHLDLADVPVLTINGTEYLQFLLDGGENDNFVTLEEFRIYQDLDPDDDDDAILVTTEANLGNLGTVVYDLDSGGDNEIDITFDSTGGSGQSDMAFNIPLDNFKIPGWNLTDNIYLWAKFSDAGGSPEEFAIFKDGTPLGSIPEPSTIWGGIACLLFCVGYILNKRRP